MARDDQSGNQTPNTPGRSETKLRHMTVDELRGQAREQNVSGASSMRKEELVQALARSGAGNQTGGDRESAEELEPQGDSKGA